MGAELECFATKNWGNVRKSFLNYLLLYRRYSKPNESTKCKCKICEERRKVVLFSQSEVCRDDIKLIDELLGRYFFIVGILI